MWEKLDQFSCEGLWSMYFSLDVKDVFEIFWRHCVGVWVCMYDITSHHMTVGKDVENWNLHTLQVGL